MMGNTSHHVATYPTTDQYHRWQAQAEAKGMSMSEWVECMVEAGIKNLQVTVSPDETNHELREQRNELKNELDRTRDRLQRLEESLYHGQRNDIIRYVEQNPGATYTEISQHLIPRVAEYTQQHLDDLEGEKIREEDGSFFIKEELDQ